MAAQRVPHELDRRVAAPGPERVRGVHHEHSGDIARVAVEPDVEDGSEQREGDQDPDGDGQSPLARANADLPTGKKELDGDGHEGRSDHPGPQRGRTVRRRLTRAQGPALGWKARHRREGRLRGRGIHGHEQFGAIPGGDAPQAGTLDDKPGRPWRQLDHGAGRVGHDCAGVGQHRERVTDLDRGGGQHRPGQLGQQAVAEERKSQLQREVRVARLERQVGESDPAGSPSKQQGRGFCAEEHLGCVGPDALGGGDGEARQVDSLKQRIIGTDERQRRSLGLADDRHSRSSSGRADGQEGRRGRGRHRRPVVDGEIWRIRITVADQRETVDGREQGAEERIGLAHHLDSDRLAAPTHRDAAVVGGQQVLAL